MAQGVERAFEIPIRREIRIDEPRLIEVQLQEVYLNSAEYMGGSTVQLIEIRPR